MLAPLIVHHQQYAFIQPILQRKYLVSFINVFICLQVDTIEAQRARRRRLLTAAHSARIRRGMIRYLHLIVDLSRAASLTDMRPMRSVVMFGVAQRFIRTFFDENPLSQLGIIVLRNGVAEKLTELSSSPVRGI